MINLLLPALFMLAQEPAVKPEAPAVQVTAPAPSKELKPLSFLCERFPFHWNQLQPLNVVVDGLKVKSIYFNKRTVTLFKSAEFGTRAVIEVENTANATRVPGFALALFDAENRLLGVASGGPKLGGVRTGDTETFDLSFHQVVERIPRADHFYLTVELTN